MKKSNGYALFSAFDALDDQTVAEALSPRETKTTILRPKKRFDVSTFFEHPAVVAAVCALVALGTVTGIVLAGQDPGEVIVPAVSAESEDATPDMPKTETVYIMTGMIDHDGDGENYPVRYAYEYDELGRMIKETVTHTFPKTVRTTDYTYDEQGRLILEYYVNVDSRIASDNGYDGELRYTYTDTSGGLMIVKTRYDREGSMINEYTEKYDTQGRLVYSSSDSFSHRIRKTETTTYTEDGYTKVTVSYSPIYEAYTSTQTVKLDEQGRMIWDELTDDEGFQHRSEYEYDEEGRVAKKVSTHKTAGTSERIYQYEYEDDGRRLIVREIYNGEPSDDYRVEEYDEQGNVIKECRFYNGKFVYDYDYTYQAIEVPIDE